MRGKKLLLNTVTALINQAVTIIAGFIIPKLIITHYGSAINGLLSSVTQFLAFFSMMEMGVGAVVRAALYKPLAEGDNTAVSKILVSSKIFFNKIGLMLLLYSIGLMLFFPLIVDNRLGIFSTAILVGAIAFNAVCNYFFGIVYSQLLNADQKSYVQLSIAILTTVLNTIASVILININATIIEVKLIAAFVFLLKPILLKWYVDRNYSIDLNIKPQDEPLKQKWNGLAQHIATYILKHSDAVILSFLSTLENVSIYYVYHLVTNGLQQLVEVLTTGIAALLGNMYAKNEFEKLQKTFSAFEWTIHTFVTWLYSVAGILIVPFVRVYTKGVTDTDYVLPIFAIFIVLASGTYCLRMPYHIMINAVGHFKETQASAIFEAVIKVGISSLFVFKYGIIGVAIGTFIAMCYRSLYLVWYLKNNILQRPISFFVKQLLVDVLTILLIILLTYSIKLDTITWYSWFVMSLKVCCVSLIVVFVINCILNRGQLRFLFKKVFERVSGTK